MPSASRLSESVSSLAEMLLPHLQILYPKDADHVLTELLALIEHYQPAGFQACEPRWNESDVMLITYGDSITRADEPPLATLKTFLDRYLRGEISTVHILPFFPYSSDDGFSVIDYRQVKPELGNWPHIEALAQDYNLMFDMVINHVSRESLWFADYISDVPPANDYFIEVDPDTDLSTVIRPRSSPLLASINTPRGTKHVWATFSEDQIDLNFRNPAVLLEIVDIMLGYLKTGARVLRLDAIAFLWKQIGTSCVHLQQTHEVVKLLRDVVEFVQPGSILLTETNVPTPENLGYFGSGDEAHMVYQFGLPPLLLHAFNRSTADYLTRWAKELPDPPSGCTYLNFTASHDGIGLRALEGVLKPIEVEDLIDSMRRFGGFVSMKANPDGTDSPYEINISYYDAMQGTRRGPDQWQLERFICSQAIMLALRGVPAIYIHSLLATPNFLNGVELTGRTRSINRRKWDYDELLNYLEAENTPNHECFLHYRRLLEVRRNEPCFHPDTPQFILEVDHSLFILLREDQQDNRRVLCIHNVTPNPVSLQSLVHLVELQETRWYSLNEEMLISDELYTQTLKPYQYLWLLDISGVTDSLLSSSTAS
jgi:glycosidase